MGKSARPDDYASKVLAVAVCHSHDAELAIGVLERALYLRAPMLIAFAIGTVGSNAPALADRAEVSVAVKDMAGMAPA
jgi:hypothetical protein